LQEQCSVNLFAIHSFDKQGHEDRNEHRTVPILDYENFCRGFDFCQTATAQRVIRIKRCASPYPNPNLPNVSSWGGPLIPDDAPLETNPADASQKY
jgi:hypothetical protein